MFINHADMNNRQSPTAKHILIERQTESRGDDEKGARPQINVAKIYIRLEFEPTDIDTTVHNCTDCDSKGLFYMVKMKKKKGRKR